MKRILLLIVAVVLAVTNSGCVYRKLTIKSTPPGASVYFNDKEIGTTPMEFDFLWYHENHVVRLEKEGYKALETVEAINAPLYLWVPIDFFAEIIPVRIEDYRQLSYKLVPEDSEKIPGQ